MLDVDNFKKYNDFHGHQVGDCCLRAIARAVEAEVARAHAEGLTKDAFAARCGREEFAVVIPRASILAYEERAKRILESAQAGYEACREPAAEYRYGFHRWMTL
jgi:diguanylate cyclase (GGDEF)-like protein